MDRARRERASRGRIPLDGTDTNTGSLGESGEDSPDRVHRGILPFAGFDVPSPHIVYGRLSEEQRAEDLAAYGGRLRGIVTENPIEVGPYLEGGGTGAARYDFFAGATTVGGRMVITLRTSSIDRGSVPES